MSWEHKNIGHSGGSKVNLIQRDNLPKNIGSVLLSYLFNLIAFTDKIHEVARRHTNSLLHIYK